MNPLLNQPFPCWTIWGNIQIYLHFLYLFSEWYRYFKSFFMEGRVRLNIAVYDLTTQEARSSAGNHCIDPVLPECTLISLPEGAGGMNKTVDILCATHSVIFSRICSCSWHNDVIKWKHFPRHWPFVRRIHRWPVNSPHKGQWRGALIFSLIYAWTNGWVNNREDGDLRRHGANRDVTVMIYQNSGTIKTYQKGAPEKLEHDLSMKLSGYEKNCRQCYLSLLSNISQSRSIVYIFCDRFW